MHLTVRRVLTSLLLAAALASTAGCSGSEEGPGTPEVALPTAKKLLDETSGVQLELKTEELPDGVDGLLDATGVGTHAPAFKGTVVLLVDGLSLRVPVIAVDGLVFARLPLTMTYSEIDPSEYGAPDPAQLMEATKGISSWLTEAVGVKMGDAVRDGDTVLTSYSGMLSGEAVASVIPSADKSADYPVTFDIAGDGELRSVDVSGPFYGEGGDVDYTITLSDYGTDEDISAP